MNRYKCFTTTFIKICRSGPCINSNNICSTRRFFLIFDNVSELKKQRTIFIVNFKYKILIIWFPINFYSSQFGSEMIWMIIKLKSCLLLKRKLTVQIGNVFLFSILFDIKFFRYHHSDENKNLFNFLNKIEMCSCEKKWIFT